MTRTKAVLKWSFFLIFGAILVAYMGARTLSAFSESDVQKVKSTGSCAGCNLRHANLEGANLVKADLREADLGGANLRGANLSGANLSGAKLGDAVLTDANLADANLKDANLAGTYLFGTDLSRSTWVDGTMCGPASHGTCEP